MSDNLCTLTKSVRKSEVVLFGTCLNARGLIQFKLIKEAKHFTLAQIAD